VEVNSAGRGLVEPEKNASNRDNGCGLEVLRWMKPRNRHFDKMSL
jgi:hypothetical protein